MDIVHPIEEFSEPTENKAPNRKFLVVVLVVGIVLGVLGVGGFVYGYLPYKALVGRYTKLQVLARDIPTLLKDKNLEGLKSKLSEVSTEALGAQKDYARLGWVRFVPFLGSYYSDGDRFVKAGLSVLDAGKLTLETVAPYADIIGLNKSAAGGGITAQQRIDLVIGTIDKVRPQLAEIGKKLSDAKLEVDKVNINKYPEKLRLSQAVEFLDKAVALVSDARPLLESLPYLVGKDDPRKYLVIFQNDAELRPTGGFMTGYAVISVANGKISVLQSDDIYKLDERFPKKIKAPDPILKYHPNVPYWYLRDQNLSPDLKASMETFMLNYKQTGSPEVDGVITLTTQVLVNLLKVTGRIGVPGYGNFSAENDPRCNCPSAFYELQMLAGGEEPVVWDPNTGKIVKAPANYGNRKQFLGPVMYSILANVMSQPKSKIPDLFSAALKSIAGKHIMFYMFDTKAQAAVESFNMAGRVGQNTDGQDYLMVVDTNFSGAKTNIWVKYKADQVIEIGSDGVVTKTVTLTYTNPQDTSVKIESGRKLNGLFRDWLRVYVPKGSELLEAKGFETGQAVGEDLGKTVFEGFFTLAPLNVKSISFKYKLPFKVKSPLKLLVQKQGGAKDFIYTTKINGKTKPEVTLDADLDLSWNY